MSKKKNGNRFTFTRKHYTSNDGMMTSIWGPSAWHFMHTISFNYPLHPTCDDKRHYRDYILNLEYTLPCGKCRENLKKNFAKLPLKWKYMENRASFSKYVYRLHELINTMLGKKSGLTYNDVRDRYEHFRARCSSSKPVEKNKTMKREKGKDKEIKDKKEKGCTEPIYGKKAKCILQIIPQDKKCETFQTLPINVQ